MKLYIDTEFNGFGGELISLALVGKDVEFYEVLVLPDKLDPWVFDNVVPYLNKDHISLSNFQDKLVKFLRPYKDVIIVASWPDDISYFCKCLITGPGERVNCRRHINFELNLNLSSFESKIPHNALEDAKAIFRSNNLKELCNVLCGTEIPET